MRDSARSPSVLRRINSAAILDAIRNRGPLSRAEVARATGLSRPTVNEVAEQLLRAGYVAEVDGRPAPTPNGWGRPGRLLRFRAELGHVLGLDVGGGDVVAVVSDLAGTVLATERQAAPSADAPATLAALRQAVTASLRAAGIPRNGLMSAAVGTPGVVDPGTGAILLAPQVRGWEGLRLGQVLGRSLPCPVVVENEVRAALVGERERGVARGHDHVAFVQIGIGIGCGIMIGGQLYRGADGSAGEIGYLPTLPSPGDARGHGFGAFEHGAGGAAFARLGAEAAATEGGRMMRQLAGGRPETVSPQVVIEAARRGDAAALAIVETLAAELARGIASVAVVLNPELVVVGGSLAGAGDLLIEPIRRALQTLVPKPPPLERSALGDEAVALGAVHLALEAAHARLYSFEASDLAT